MSRTFPLRFRQGARQYWSKRSAAEPSAFCFPFDPCGARPLNLWKSSVRLETSSRGELCVLTSRGPLTPSEGVSSTNQGWQGSFLSDSMKMSFIALRALLCTVRAALFFVGVLLRIRTFDQSFGILLVPWTKTPGVILMVIGAVLVLASFGVFVARGRGTTVPLDPPTEVVAVGPGACLWLGRCAVRPSRAQRSATA